MEKPCKKGKLKKKKVYLFVFNFTFFPLYRDKEVSHCHFLARHNPGSSPALGARLLWRISTENRPESWAGLLQARSGLCFLGLSSGLFSIRLLEVLPLFSSGNCSLFFGNHHPEGRITLSSALKLQYP